MHKKVSNPNSDFNFNNFFGVLEIIQTIDLKKKMNVDFRIFESFVVLHTIRISLLRRFSRCTSACKVDFIIYHMQILIN